MLAYAVLQWALALAMGSVTVLANPIQMLASPQQPDHGQWISQNTLKSPPDTPPLNPNATKTTPPPPTAMPLKAMDEEAMPQDGTYKKDTTTGKTAAKPPPSPWKSRNLSGHALGGMGSTYGVPPNSNPMVGKNAPRQPILRVGILSTAQNRRRTMRVAALLQDYQYGTLEKKIGMQIDVVRIVTVRRTAKRDYIRHRPGFLQAALQLAQLLPGQQTISKWRHFVRHKQKTPQNTLDIEILLRQSSKQKP